jgi:hypothetical protein
MSVSIPQPFVTSVSVPGTLAANATVTLTNNPLKTEVSGIPDHFTISVDQLPEIKLGITALPPIELKLTELPSIRAHLPAAFNVGLSVLGLELMSVRLCGEAQMITEPYKANPCEGCGPTEIKIDDAVTLVKEYQATEAKRQ